MFKTPKLSDMCQVEELLSHTRNQWPLSIEDRKVNLLNLLRFVEEQEEEIIRAIQDDLSRPRHEILMSEILPVKFEIKQFIKKIYSWTAPKPVPKSYVMFNNKCKTELHPLGTIFVISTWNYPFQLLFLPLAGALAAGNCVVIKPSEIAPAVEAFLKETLPRYLDRSILQIFTGDAGATKRFMQKNKFDLIFFTGSTTVGREVMAEAAKTLTPVCLELGGKCPVYVDSSADVKLAANRVMWGKIFNLGQTCLAPDYVLCQESIKTRFVEECQSAMDTFYQGLPTLETEDYGRIINERHTRRLMDLIAASNGKVAFGGNGRIEKRFIEPTVIVDVTETEPLMENEIFGPILPVISVESSDRAMEIVNKRPTPLGLYVFSTSDDLFQEWKQRTQSGGIMHNDVIMLKGAPGMMFGGLGPSGMGKYQGRASIDLFSNLRGVVDSGKSDKMNQRTRYPPYSAKMDNMVRFGYREKKTPLA